MVWLQTDLAHRRSGPHPSASTAEASEALCSLRFQAPAGLTCIKSQATIPFPSGPILQGRRINRSDLGRPAVPKRCQNPDAGRRKPERSQHRSPGGPSTLSLRSHIVRRASVLTAASLPETEAVAGSHRSDGIRRPGPSHAYAESKAQTHASTANPHSAHSQTPPFPKCPTCPQTRHPWIACTL